MHDIFTMIVTQKINVARLNSARCWMDDKTPYKTQRASFENLTGRLGLWHSKERNAKERCFVNDLIDLINFWTFCLFINVYFLCCVVILLFLVVYLLFSIM